MTQRFFRLAVLSGCLLASDLLIGQGLYGFLKDTPAGRFDKMDWDLLQNALQDALEDKEAGGKADWNNPETGHFGRIIATKAFRSKEGHDCKRVLIENTAGSFKSANKFDLCRYEDGSWRDLASGAPFTAPAQ